MQRIRAAAATSAASSASTTSSPHPGCNTLADGAWITAGEPLCLIGDSGTGKSHLLIGLGTAAAQQGFRVRYALATKLVNELVEAADERQLAKTIARYGRVDLLCVDELGYMELDRRGAELLFQVLTEREETSSIAIVSNQPFSGWTSSPHRPPALRRDHRPPHLRREHPRDRHHLLPPRPRPVGDCAPSWHCRWGLLT